MMRSHFLVVLFGLLSLIAAQTPTPSPPETPTPTPTPPETPTPTPTPPETPTPTPTPPETPTPTPTPLPTPTPTPLPTPTPTPLPTPTPTPLPTPTPTPLPTPTPTPLPTPTPTPLPTPTPTPLPTPTPTPTPVTPTPQPEPAPAPHPVPPAPSSPAPTPVQRPINEFVYDMYTTGANVSARTGALAATNPDMSKIWIVGGLNKDGNVADIDVFDLESRMWSKPALKFTRTGACGAQDSGTTGLWIFGGSSSNFTLLSTTTQTPTELTKPEPVLPLTGVSCAIVGDKFYSLFGSVSGQLSELAGVFEVGTNKWSVKNNSGKANAPAPREGAAVIAYKNSIVVFGGQMGTTLSNDVYRLDVGAWTWSKDASTNVPAGRAYSSAYYLNNDILYIFGGITATGPVAQALSYNLNTMAWTVVNATGLSLPGARQKASVVPLLNRAFFFGGDNTNAYWGDAFQLVSEGSCLGKGCEDCTKDGTSGCGWCGGNAEENRCVAGTANKAFVASTCDTSSPYTTDIDQCPELFPSYAIALIVIGGVVLVGIIIFACMKIRNSKSDYQQIS